MKKIKLGRFLLEFLSVFIAVISAFALNNWSENRKNTLAEEKILTEIKNGFESDLEELKVNRIGHENGLIAYNVFTDLLEGKDVNQDSIDVNYFNLTNGSTLNMNTSGYESLKSRGLELVSNDSLRIKIIQLYEFDYASLRKFEEEFQLTQFFENYFIPINDIISPFLAYDNYGYIERIDIPLNLNIKEKKLLQSYLWQISFGRNGLLEFYEETELKVRDLQKAIERELQSRN